MNPSSLIGLVASLLLLGTTIFFSTDDPWRFVDWVGLGIVLGGTVAATFLSYPLKEIVALFRLIATVMRSEHLRTRQDLDELVRISRLWARGDLNAVETALEQVTNPFLRTGVQLIIDRTPEQEILDLLQWRISRLRTREAAEAQMFRVMAAYAPAFGMLGTLLGLVNLMDLLGAGDMGAIGRQLGVALMTTFYGILLANLVFKPVAVKLERRTEKRLVLMNMVLQGVSMMCARRSPALMKETLNSFIAHFEDEIFDGGARYAARDGGNDVRAQGAEGRA